MKHHHYHSPWRRAFYSFLLISFVMIVGTIGMHCLENMPYIQAFYFMSMIATAQGSAYTPQTTSGILFASLMAFISVGAVMAAVGFLFGPFFGKLWKVGSLHFEEELQNIKKHSK